MEVTRIGNVQFESTVWIAPRGRTHGILYRNVDGVLHHVCNTPVGEDYATREMIAREMKRAVGRAIRDGGINLSIEGTTMYDSVYVICPHCGATLTLTIAFDENGFAYPDALEANGDDTCTHTEQLMESDDIQYEIDRYVELKAAEL